MTKILLKLRCATMRVGKENISQNMLLLIILLMAPLSGMGIDIYVPSLPYITQHFNVAQSLAQLTVPVYVLGYGISQFIIATMADYYDRRKMAITGLGILFFATFLIPLSPNIYILLLLRFLQGMAVGTPGGLSKVLLIHNYQGKTFTRNSNYLTTAWALGPIVAPLLGGYFQHYLSWKFSFYFLAFYVLILWGLCVFTLHEKPYAKPKMNWPALKKNYTLILSETAYLSTAGVLFTLYGIMLIFNVVGPFLVQTVMGYSAVAYGKFALLLGVMWFLGSTLNPFFVRRFPQRKIMAVAITFISIIAGSALFLSFWLPMSIYLLLIPTLLLFFFASVVFANGFGTALSFFPTMGGTASGLMGVLFSIAASFITAGAALLESTNFALLFSAYFVMGLLQLLLFTKIIAPAMGRLQESQSSESRP